MAQELIVDASNRIHHTGLSHRSLLLGAVIPQGLSILLVDAALGGHMPRRLYSITCLAERLTGGRTDERTSGQADERTGGQADRRTSGRADGQTSGQADGRTDGRTAEADERTGGYADKRTSGQTDGRTNGQSRRTADMEQSDGRTNGQAD